MALQFRKELIAAESFESAAIFDVDNDGVLDIVSGSYWYQGPDFRKRHFLGDIGRFGEYWDDFWTIPMPVAESGRMDYITGGYWGNALKWRENPAKNTGLWTEHVIAPAGNIETTRSWDIDGDGDLEIIPNVTRGPLIVYKLIRSADGRSTRQFRAYKLYNANQGHGLGFGDLRGLGRPTIIMNHGWLEAPCAPGPGVDLFAQQWTYHKDFDIKYRASIPMIIADVDSDGLNDLIIGSAHGYGLEWLQQHRSSDDQITWTHHPIDSSTSQFHDMRWIDIDGDGKPELVTGKRFRAHNGADPGEFDPLGIYYYKWTGKHFDKYIISHGPPGEGVGAGIQFDLADLRGTGRLDIVAPGKDGLYIPWNQGQ